MELYSWLLYKKKHTVLQAGGCPASAAAQCSRGWITRRLTHPRPQPRRGRVVWGALCQLELAPAAAKTLMGPVLSRYQGESPQGGGLSVPGACPRRGKHHLAARLGRWVSPGRGDSPAGNPARALAHACAETLPTASCLCPARLSCRLSPGVLTPDFVAL